MIATSLYLAIGGLDLTFIPEELSIFFDTTNNPKVVLALQILGALYLGFAMMNWMVKESLVGGIYNRPLVFGNFLNFVVSAFALLKAVGNYSNFPFLTILMITILYCLFAIGFGLLLRSNPAK